MGENTTNIVTPFWADEACRLAEAARAAPWAETAGAAMVAAAAHSARWLATAASDPATAAQLSHIEQLSQAASEAWDRVRWVQRVAVQAGCVGRGCRSLETGVATDAMGGWGRRVAAAGAVARRLARVTGVTLPTNEFGEFPPASLDSPEDSALDDSSTTPTSSVLTSPALAEDHETVRARTAPAGLSRGEVAVAATVEESVPEEAVEIPPPDTTEGTPAPPPLAPGTEAGPKAAEKRRSKSARHSSRKRRRSAHLEQRCIMDTVRIVLRRIFKSIQMRTLAAAAAFVLAVLLLLTNSPGVNPIASWGHSQLALDLEAFESLLTVPRVKSLVLRTMRTDPDVHRALKYMGTARFRRRCLIIEAMPEVQQLSQLLAADGVGLRTTFRAFNEQLELTYSRVKARKVKRKSKAGEDEEDDTPRGSLKPLFEELQSALPSKQIQGLYQQKMKESEPFRRFIEYIQGPEGSVIGRKLRHTKECGEIVRTLRDREIGERDITEYVSWLFTGTTEDPKQAKNQTQSANATEDRGKKENLYTERVNG